MSDIEAIFERGRKLIEEKYREKQDLIEKSEQILDQRWRMIRNTLFIKMGELFKFVPERRPKALKHNTTTIYIYIYPLSPCTEINFKVMFDIKEDGTISGIQISMIEACVVNDAEDDMVPFPDVTCFETAVYRCKEYEQQQIAKLMEYW